MPLGDVQLPLNVEWKIWCWLDVELPPNGNNEEAHLMMGENMVDRVRLRPTRISKWDEIKKPADALTSFGGRRWRIPESNR